MHNIFPFKRWNCSNIHYILLISAGNNNLSSRLQWIKNGCVVKPSMIACVISNPCSRTNPHEKGRFNLIFIKSAIIGIMLRWLSVLLIFSVVLRPNCKVTFVKLIINLNIIRFIIIVFTMTGFISVRGTQARIEQ